MPQQVGGNALFVAARKARGWHTQEDFAEEYERHARRIGERASVSVRQVRRWESGCPPWPNRDARRVLQLMFGVALTELGFARPGERIPGDAPTKYLKRPEFVYRRTFLSIVAGAAPMLTLDDLHRLDASLANARRYADAETVGHLRMALDEAGRADGSSGPRDTLPVVLGLIAAVDSTARDALQAVRRDLLRIGARAAEFAAWLYRDAGAAPHVIAYWQDRAMEWATVTADGSMQAYVLLRKAQACQGDGARMLDLATAVVDGPWSPPSTVKAEAVQQQARGMALTGAPPDAIAHRLDAAREMLAGTGTAPASSVSGPLGAGYTEALLMLQSAIGLREAKRPAQSVELFRTHLVSGAFSTRDRAFLASHMAVSLADAGEPDEAARTAFDVLPTALSTQSARTVAELTQVARRLRPYADRPLVRDLREALAVSG